MRSNLLKAMIAALALAPVAVQAQSIDCNTGIDGEWIAGSQGESNVVSFMNEAPVDLAISVPADSMHVALFEVEGTDNIRIEVVGDNDSDPVVEIRNESGLRIAEDDDSGGNGNARVEAVLDPGIYCVISTGFDGIPVNATVRVGTVAQEALTANTAAPYCNVDTPAEWMAEGGIERFLSEGVNYTGSVDESPYMKFTLYEPTSLSISARNEDADPVLYLFDAYGNQLAENDDFDGLDSRIDMAAPLEAGDYCIAIRALTDTSLPINVSVFEYDAEAIMGNMYDNLEASPPLDGSYPVTDLGTMDGRLREDAMLQDSAAWYSVEVDGAGLLLIEGIAVGDVDPYLVVFDDVGREIGRNDDGGEGYDSLIAAKVFAGTYLIGVSLAGGPGTGTVRLVAQRYVPAD